MTPTTPSAEALRNLVHRLRNGGWDLRSPQEMADMIADMIEGALSAEPNAQAQAADDEAAFTATLIQRDLYHDIADELAERIAKITGVEIGEHTSNNDPWMNAKYAADEYIALLPQPPKPTPSPEAREPAEPSITLNLAQARALVEFFGGEDTEAKVARVDLGHSGAGLYVWCADYPEEGSVLLDADAAPVSQAELDSVLASFKPMEREVLAQLAQEQEMSEAAVLRQALRIYQAGHLGALKLQDTRPVSLMTFGAAPAQAEPSTSHEEKGQG